MLPVTAAPINACQSGVVVSRLQVSRILVSKKMINLIVFDKMYQTRSRKNSFASEQYIETIMYTDFVMSRPYGVWNLPLHRAGIGTGQCEPPNAA
jgi:hypothetical protein